MRARFIVPCRRARRSSGAAWTAICILDTCLVATIPARCVFQVLIGYESEPSDADWPLELQLEVYSPDWELLFQRSHTLTLGSLTADGDPWVCYWAPLVEFTARSTGPHEVRCRLGDEVLAQARLTVARGDTDHLVERHPVM